MQYNVPQFIERESKINPFFTFKQFVYMVVAALISLFVYLGFSFSIGLLVFFITEGIALALAFGKIEGIGLPKVIANFFKYKLSPNVYIWKKEKVPFRAFKRMEEVQEKKENETKEDETGLKIAGRSKLRKLKTNIEVK